jgi:hypothetical protein
MPISRLVPAAVAAFGLLLASAPSIAQTSGSNEQVLSLATFDFSGDLQSIQELSQYSDAKGCAGARDAMIANAREKGAQQLGTDLVKTGMLVFQLQCVSVGHEMETYSPKQVTAALENPKSVTITVPQSALAVETSSVLACATPTGDINLKKGQSLHYVEVFNEPKPHAGPGFLKLTQFISVAVVARQDGYVQIAGTPLSVFTAGKVIGWVKETEVRDIALRNCN